MTYAWMEQHPTSEIFSVAWIIDAPWAHPVWNQYLVALYDLTTPSEKSGPVKRYLDGATHEFLVRAINPNHPIPKDARMLDVRFYLLDPPNYGYQFKADSNEAAQARVQEIVDAIVAEKLSPDTDFRSLWDKLLADCFPLVTTFGGAGGDPLH